MMIRDICEHSRDVSGSLSGNAFIYHQAGMIVDPFLEW